MQGLRIVIVDEQERLARSQGVEGLEDSAVAALAWGRPLARILLRLQTVRATGRPAEQPPRDHIAALIAFIEEHSQGCSRANGNARFERRSIEDRIKPPVAGRSGKMTGTSIDMYDAALQCGHHCLRPIFHAQTAQNYADVALHGGLGDPQEPGDLLVAPS